jgi:integrase
MFGEIKDRGAPILANRTLGYVVTMLNWCVAVGLLEQSPAHGLKRHLRTRERPRSRVLTDVELRRVWAATFTSDGFPAWYGPLVRLAILTGHRRGEIAALQGEWIDGAWITVPADFYKTERPHRFYLTHLACKQLPVPRRDGRRFPSDPPWSRHKLALERATRLEGWILHDLRRTFATGLVKMASTAMLSSSASATCSRASGRPINTTASRRRNVEHSSAGRSTWRLWVS